MGCPRNGHPFVILSPNRLNMSTTTTTTGVNFFVSGSTKNGRTIFNETQNNRTVQLDWFLDFVLGADEGVTIVSLEAENGSFVSDQYGSPETSLRYVADAGFYGTDVVTYTLSDGTVGTYSYTVIGDDSGTLRDTTDVYYYGGRPSPNVAESNPFTDQEVEFVAYDGYDMLITKEKLLEFSYLLNEDGTTNGLEVELVGVRDDFNSTLGYTPIDFIYSEELGGYLINSSEAQNRVTLDYVITDTTNPSSEPLFFTNWVHEIATAPPEGYVPPVYDESLITLLQFSTSTRRVIQAERLIVDYFGQTSDVTIVSVEALDEGSTGSLFNNAVGQPVLDLRATAEGVYDYNITLSNGETYSISLRYIENNDGVDGETINFDFASTGQNSRPELLSKPGSEFQYLGYYIEDTGKWMVTESDLLVAVTDGDGTRDGLSAEIIRLGADFGSTSSTEKIITGLEFQEVIYNGERAWTFDISSDFLYNRVQFDYVINDSTDGFGPLVTSTYFSADRDRATIPSLDLNVAPDALDATFTITERQLLTEQLVATDDGAVTFELVGDPITGLSLSADGQLTFDADQAEFRSLLSGETDTITGSYRVTDAEGLTDTATFTINIEGLDPTTADFSQNVLDMVSDLRQNAGNLDMRSQRGSTIRGIIDEYNISEQAQNISVGYANDLASGMDQGQALGRARNELQEVLTQQTPDIML